MLLNNSASAATRNPLGSSDTGSARNRIMPQMQCGSREKVEVIDRSRSNPTDPKPPAPAAWVPRSDRRIIIDAFSSGIGIKVLGRRQRRPYTVIESILRDRIDELEGRIRHMQEDARLRLMQRSAA